MRKAPQHAYEALTPRQRAYLQGRYQRAPFGALRGTLSMPEVPQGLQRSKRLWTMCIPPDTIFVTLVGDMGSVEDGACLNALGAWGRDQFESSEVAQSTQLVAGGNRCLCGRVGWRRRDLRIVGSCRRY